MMKLPGFERATALAVLTAVLAVPVAPLLAQDATQPTPAAAPAPADATTAPTTDAAAPAVDMKSSVEDFWHYGKIARYDLAAASGQKVIASGASPLDVLAAFEGVAAERQDNLDQWLLRWQGVPQLHDVSTKISGLIAEGYRQRRSDPAFIREQIGRLGTNERAYGLAMTRLRESGELAVPFLIDILRDPTRAKEQPIARRALRDLGRYALNPLVAATEMQDSETLAIVAGVLGDLGYDAAVPYVARLYENKQAPASVHSAAADTLQRLSASNLQGSSASDYFFGLGEKFYYGQSAITADNRYPTANVWYWDQGQGLSRVEVPQQIFNPIMAMRACEYALKLNGSKSDDALALWLAANYKREALLPEGATDGTRPPNYPPGHYWGVSAGAKYLDMALGRAIHDRDSAVAFRSVRSLEEIVGQSNTFVSGAAHQPLIDAMQFPDRRVRFESALTLAAATPKESFEGAQRVVPLLGEAISQTGAISVLLVGPSQDDLNKLGADLKAAGYLVAASTSPEGAVAAAEALASVDVIIAAEDLGPGNVDKLFNLASDNAHVSGAAHLVMTHTGSSMYEARTATEPLLSTTTATDAAGLKGAVDAARVKAGTLPLDQADATEYATRAANAMYRLGVNSNSVYPLSPAKTSLLASLGDARPDVVKLAGRALGTLHDADAQVGLLQAASDEKTADDVKISLYKSLAANAKLYGNSLNADQTQTLEKTVASATNLDVRSAAAEARGALNLPADQAKHLVVQQSKT